LTIIVKSMLSLIFPVSSFTYSMTSYYPTLLHGGIYKSTNLFSLASNGTFSFLIFMIVGLDEVNSKIVCSYKGLVYGNLYGVCLPTTV
jgi:hypothetical protein